MKTSTMVDVKLLSTFLEQATEALNSVVIDGVVSRSEIRSLLLDVQHSTLTRVVDEYNKHTASTIASNKDKVNVEQVQQVLKEENHSELEPRKEALNEAARMAFARLVLFSGISSSMMNKSQSKLRRELKDLGGLDRMALLEFCALFQSALKLTTVQEYLADPTRPLVAGLRATTTSTSIASENKPCSPPKQIREIQSILFQMLGYDPEYAHSEMERLFYCHEPNSSNEFEHDEQVIHAVLEMVRTAQESIAKACQEKQCFLSDQDQGGVTRVVAVNYSETVTVANEDGQTFHSTGAPKQERMQEASELLTQDPDTTDQQRLRRQQENRLHVAAATLEEELYQYLASLDKTERATLFAKAREAAQNFVQQVGSLSPGKDRVDFLQSLDPSTQRLLILDKLGERHWPGTGSNSEE